MGKITYTKEMHEWILANADVGAFKSQRNFTDVFNAIFGSNVTYASMCTYLYRHKIVVKTKQNTSDYTDEMDSWLKTNYANYDNDWMKLAKDFNSEFGTDFSNARLCKYCERTLKIHIPREKKGAINRGTFTVGNKYNSRKNLPIGTVREYNSSTSKMLYIKVKDPDGESGILSGRGHNYKRPWWIPLKEKVWIDAHGEIPEGCSVIQLDRDYKNCNLDNLVLADKRGLAIMGSHKWWSDDSRFNAVGIQWCNLYMTAKDNGVMDRVQTS